MTLADCERIFRYWQERSPPTFEAVGIIARMLGWKPRAAAAPATPDELRALATTPGSGMALANASGMPMPIFDIEELRARNRARAPSI
jgi:hypothetical protein